MHSPRWPAPGPHHPHARRVPGAAPVRAADIPDRPGQPIAELWGVSSAEALAGAARLGETLRESVASPLRCWQCGTEPTGVADARTFGEPEPVLIPTGWPDGDHEHAVNPPTPTELVDAGDRIRARMLEDR